MTTDDFMVRVAASDTGIVASHYWNGGSLAGAMAELAEWFAGRDEAAGVRFERDIAGIAQSLWDECAAADRCLKCSRLVAEHPIGQEWTHHPLTKARGYITLLVTPIPYACRLSDQAVHAPAYVPAAFVDATELR